MPPAHPCCCLMDRFSGGEDSVDIVGRLALIVCKRHRRAADHEDLSAYASGLKVVRQLPEKHSDAV